MTLSLGTYGDVPDAHTASTGGETLFGLGSAQKRQAMQILGQQAEEEARRNQSNKVAESNRKAGNSQLGSTLGGAVAGAAFGPWGALAGAAIGAIAGYQL